MEGVCEILKLEFRICFGWVRYGRSARNSDFGIVNDLAEFILR